MSAELLTQLKIIPSSRDAQINYYVYFHRFSNGMTTE